MAKRRTTAAAYRCIRGIAWPNPEGGELTAAPGDLRDDLPAQYVAEWIEIGAIEPADAGGADNPVAGEEER